MQMSSSSFVLSLPFLPISPSTAKFTPRCFKNCRVMFEKAARSKTVGTHLRGVPYLVFYLGRLGEPPLPKDVELYAIYFASAAWAAARRAMGRRKGLKLT